MGENQRLAKFQSLTPVLMCAQGQDLSSGNITAPAIFALADMHVGSELSELIQSEFIEPGSLQRAMELVEIGGGLQAARRLARAEADLALESLKCLDDCPAKRSLEDMVGYVLDRLY